jgi:hypothetical protein
MTGHETDRELERCNSNDGASLGLRYRHRSQLRLLLIFTLLMLHLSIVSAADISISLDSLEGSPGDDIPLRLIIENTAPVASVIVPLRYDETCLFPDSVTFHGSIVSPDQLFLSTQCHDSSLVRVLVLPTVTSPMPVMYDPGGLLATVWFSVSPFAKPGFSIVDTAYVYDSICFEDDCYYYCPEELQASDFYGNQEYPTFKPGGIEIRPGSR